MPRRNEEAHISLGNPSSKTHFTINQYDDTEIKIIIDDICSLEKSNLTLHIEKPNKEKDKSGVLKTVLDNIAEFEVKGTVFNQPGLYKGQLQIVDYEGAFSSTIFIFNVLESITDDAGPIPPPVTEKAICGEFLCGELLCGEGLDIEKVNTKSSLSEEFLRNFGGGMNE
ncbi:TPA: hypothetical protein ACOTG0_002111 [Clostridium perfringens]|nr:hypothetical protein phiCPD_00024 [Clostridium phage phiCp-D]